MGCGMSRSHLLDEAFGSRTPFHHNTHTPKLLIKDSPQPPRLQHINTFPTSSTDPTWLGSPSFRVYVQSGPDPDDNATKGDEHGGKKLICNHEVCVLEDSNGNTLAGHRRGGRFRKAFQVHRVTFWHGGGPWHVGHAKPTTKPA